MNLSVFYLLMLLAALVLLVIAAVDAENLVHHHHAQKCDFFDHYPIQPGDIVFLGDSITAGANWDELFPGKSAKNRGINADTTTGVLKRLAPIISGKPSAVFILIGTNDLFWYEYKTDASILKDYRAILTRFHQESPQTKIFIQSILPRQRMYATRIRCLNQKLADLAAEFKDTYIDLWTHFVGSQGELRAEFNNDSLHLLGAGYAVWVEILTPYLSH